VDAEKTDISLCQFTGYDLVDCFLGIYVKKTSAQKQRRCNWTKDCRKSRIWVLKAR